MPTLAQIDAEIARRQQSQQAIAPSLADIDAEIARRQQLAPQQAAPIPQQAAPQPQVPVAQQAPDLSQPALPGGVAKPGGEEALGTIASGMIAEPIAGLAGLATLPFAGPEQAEANIEAVREALTFIPRTPEGMEQLQKVGEALQPVGEAVQAVEKGAGDIAFEATGSPVLSAIATTAPTAALTALGAGGVRRALGLSKLANKTKGLLTESSKKLLKNVAPTIDNLKTAARGVYKEIDDLGITINPRSVTGLSNELQTVARKAGFNKTIHPKVSAALKEFQSVKGKPQTLTQIDILRKVANGAARSIEPDEARIGSMLLSKIDDSLDNLKSANFVNPSKADVGAKFRDARQLWRRAKKSELLEEAFDKANLQATGFENGIRTQFRSILNSKKKRMGFTPEELDAMKQVVKGGTAENMAKMIGRFGFSEGQASNMLMGSMGVAGGAALGGAPGAVAVPLIGQLSRTLAQKLTRGGAEAADLIVRAGKEGDDIVKAYLKITTPKTRNATELTELLMRPGINLKALKLKVAKLPKSEQKLIKDAVFFADFIQSQKNQTEEK
jgi:hypothetical protein